MKKIHLFTVAIGAAMLAAAPVFAGPWDVNPDTAGGILEKQDRPAYVGTSLSGTRERVYINGSPNSAYPNYHLNETGYVVGTAGPEKGQGDEYGSVLFDVGILR